MPSMILTGHKLGKVTLFNDDIGKEVPLNTGMHMDIISDLQLSTNWSYFITRSKNKTMQIDNTKMLSFIIDNKSLWPSLRPLSQGLPRLWKSHGLKLGQALNVGLHLAWGFLKPKPPQAKPKLGLPGQAGPEKP